MTAWLFLLLAYVIGSIPTSYIAGRVAGGIDLREHGSGNLGTTNAFRVLGWRIGAPVFAFDVSKGFLPAAFFPLWDHAVAGEWALAYGAAAILGHVFSIFLGLKGGKGVATGAGVFLALAPWALGATLLAWTALAWRTRLVSLASLAAALILPLAVYLIRGAGVVLWLALAAGVFVVYAHRSNVRRLLRGEEHRFGDRRMGKV